jgi:hypothetical protein
MNVWYAAKYQKVTKPADTSIKHKNDTYADKKHIRPEDEG